MAKKDLRARLKKRREELKSRSQSGNLVFIKADTTLRVRILPAGEDEEFIKEVTQFYLGGDIKGVISPVSIDEPCAIMEAYEELKNSEDEEDKSLAKKFAPRQRYLAFCLLYKDEKGKQIDEEKGPKFVILTSGMYQDIIDLYLDEDDWGDMTDPGKQGYDLKLSRTGSGKTDTEYSVTPCPKSALPKGVKFQYDIDKEFRAIIPTYEATKEIAAKFLNLPAEDDDDEDSPKKPKKTGSKKIIKKKRDL